MKLMQMYNVNQLSNEMEFSSTSSKVLYRNPLQQPKPDTSSEVDASAMQFGDVEAKESVVEKVKTNIYHKVEIANKKSSIWQHYFEIRDFNGQFTSYVMCKVCDAVFLRRTGKYGTTTLRRHHTFCHEKALKPPKRKNSTKDEKSDKSPRKGTTNEDLKSMMLNACMSLCIKDTLPFDIFKSKGMIDFTNALLNVGAVQGKLNVEDIFPSKISIQKHANEKAKEILPLLIEKIKYILKIDQHVAISTQIWTDIQNQKYLSIKCHYIDDDWNLQATLLGCIKLFGQKSTNALYTEVKNYLISLGFDAEDIASKFTFVVNSHKNLEANMVPCMIHIINSILYYTFGELPDQNVEEYGDIYYELQDQEFYARMQVIFKSCEDMYNHMKITNFFYTQYEKDNGWNNKYNMLMDMSKYEILIRTHFSLTNDQNMLHKMDFETLNSIAAFLEPFKGTVDALLAEDMCTIYGILLFKLKLDSHLELKYNDSPFLRKLKSRAEIVHRDKFIILQKHCTATLLCPKYKNLQFLAGNQKQETIRILEMQLGEIKVSGESNGLKSKQEQQDIEVKEEALLDFEEFCDTSYADHGENDELSKYLQTSFVHEISDKSIGSINILKFWKDNENTFPRLASIAKSVMCIPSFTNVDQTLFGNKKSIYQIRAKNVTGDSLHSMLIMKSRPSSASLFASTSHD